MITSWVGELIIKKRPCLLEVLHPPPDNGVLIKGPYFFYHAFYPATLGALSLKGKDPISFYNTLTKAMPVLGTDQSLRVELEKCNLEEGACSSAPRRARLSVKDLVASVLTAVEANIPSGIPGPSRTANPLSSICQIVPKLLRKTRSSAHMWLLISCGIDVYISSSSQPEKCAVLSYVRWSVFCVNIRVHFVHFICFEDMRASNVII